MLYEALAKAELCYHRPGRAFCGTRDEGSVELPALEHRHPVLSCRNHQVDMCDHRMSNARYYE